MDITTGTNTGTLLDVQDLGGGNAILWIRPDTSAAGNDFDDIGTLTCNVHTASFTYDVTPPVVSWATGESLWSNIYTLGTIEANTHIYISQNGTNLVAYKDTTDWWSDGHIDILVNVKEASVEIDEGYITVLARQYSKTYSNYIVDLTNGGRNPIPLQTGNDLDNQTGFWTFTGSAGSAPFTVGEVISKSSTNKKGVITAVAGTTGAPILTYYLIGDPITNFVNGDTLVTGATSGSITGTFNEGEPVSQATSGAKGTVVEKNTTDKIIILRNSRGTFNTANVVTETTNSGTLTPDTEASAVTPIAAAPFGTFAGGKFFCAPGVVLADYLTADANNFQLVDDQGTVRVAPTKATITVSNTRAGDKIAVFRLTASGGDINKSEYNATVQSQAATTVVVGSTISSDSPGKASGGVIRLVDVSANIEYRLRFSTWTGPSTFNLAYTNVASAEAGTTTTNVTATGIGTASLVGDLVMNVTQTNAVAYVTAIVDANNVTISPAITGQTSTNNIKFNALPVATTTSPQDTCYVPFIDAYEITGTNGTPGTEAITITHSSTDADIYIRARARQAGQILPFEQDSSVVGANPTNISVIRTADTIFQ